MTQQFQPQYPYQQQPQYAPPPSAPKKRNLFKSKWFWIAIIALVLLSGISAALGGGGNNSTTSTSNTPVATTQPTTAQATQAPKPTAKPTQAPTRTPAQIEQIYKASAKNTSITALDKNGSSGIGDIIHFTATISGFVKDDSGNTAGANVTDANYSSFIQVIFPDGTDVNKLNKGDTLEIWGTDMGTFSGTNAFGATIQEVGVAAQYMTDQTTGYHAG